MHRMRATHKKNQVPGGNCQTIRNIAHRCGIDLPSLMRHVVTGACIPTFLEARYSVSVLRHVTVRTRMSEQRRAIRVVVDPKSLILAAYKNHKTV